MLIFRAEHGRLPFPYPAEFIKRVINNHNTLLNHRNDVLISFNNKRFLYPYLSALHTIVPLNVPLLPSTDVKDICDSLALHFPVILM